MSPTRNDEEREKSKNHAITLCRNCFRVINLTQNFSGAPMLKLKGCFACFPPLFYIKCKLPDIIVIELFMGVWFCGVSILCC